MKILAITGSKNKIGQTARSVEAFISGATDKETFSKHLFLTDLDISRCKQCDNEGWGKCRYEGRCIIEDDFQMLVTEIKESDIIAIATPVYFSDMSESVKCFLERLRRTCITDKGKIGIVAKPVIGICLAGGSGGGSINCMHNMETMLLHCGFNIVDMVSVKRQNFIVKQDILKILGKWVAENDLK